jgi:hypothetical protein
VRVQKMPRGEVQERAMSEKMIGLGGQARACEMRELVRAISERVLGERGV